MRFFRGKLEKNMKKITEIIIIVKQNLSTKATNKIKRRKYSNILVNELNKYLFT